MGFSAADHGGLQDFEVHHPTYAGAHADLSDRDRALDVEERRHLAHQISRTAAALGQPIDAVTVVFIEPQAVFVHGGEQIPPARFDRVDVTIGVLDEAQRRELARTVGGLLCDAGVREDAMTLIFHDANGPQVAVGRGTFPFWPEA
jgi:phenylpyruvate tautomerase PptA (4-oxalocrotonate tautomerase family)